jgi:hypothetical protein
MLRHVTYVALCAWFTSGYDEAPPRRNFNSLSMFDAMRRGSSRVSRLAAPAGLVLVVAIGQRLPVGVADDEAGIRLLDGPARREAAPGHTDPTRQFRQQASAASTDRSSGGRALTDPKIPRAGPEMAAGAFSPLKGRVTVSPTLARQNQSLQKFK